ncbi:MAG: PIG-L family deacetylase [Chloroflexota bacterium]
MSKKRILISYAHPDDESFGNGGTIAKYVAEGADVYLICATDGDVGTIPEDMQDQYETTRELRLAELHAANEILKFKEMFLFQYKDSGMMGNEANEDPDCLWATYHREPESVEHRVVEVIRKVRPQVVITFNEYGGYGHPDHIAIQRATVKAFDLAGDPNYITDGLAPYQPQKLYYSAIPARFLKTLLFILKLRGLDTTAMGTNKDINFDAIIDHIEPVHTAINIADYIEEWDAASACHKSQGGGGAQSLFGRLPMWVRQMLQGTQTFTRVHPAPDPQGYMERDLFAGVPIFKTESEPEPVN